MKTNQCQSNAIQFLLLRGGDPREMELTPELRPFFFWLVAPSVWEGRARGIAKKYIIYIYSFQKRYNILNTFHLIP